MTWINQAVGFDGDGVLFVFCVTVQMGFSLSQGAIRSSGSASGPMKVPGQTWKHLHPISNLAPISDDRNNDDNNKSIGKDTRIVSSRAPSEVKVVVSWSSATHRLAPQARHDVKVVVVFAYSSPSIPTRAPPSLASNRAFRVQRSRAGIDSPQHAQPRTEPKALGSLSADCQSGKQQAADMAAGIVPLPGSGLWVFFFSNRRRQLPVLASCQLFTKIPYH
ncbi:hypothetical protein B0T18DRAFT_212942 [Schizothecium vesticola]|uniref:Uncharacterized protein n=1 Tax=Schizothecium vesticola TaxID=314040 RepID=A0AA40JZA0_9PEZI|nr:hypothetical protein B0T18DRAFT_212942 [Schizothecium vesticola]